MSKVFKHTISIVVFSTDENPIAAFGEDWDLASVAEQIDTGDCIGGSPKVQTKPVPADKLHDELLSIGNDGTFFDVGDVGDNEEEGTQPWFSDPDQVKLVVVLNRKINNDEIMALDNAVGTTLHNVISNEAVGEIEYPVDDVVKGQKIAQRIERNKSLKFVDSVDVEDPEDDK